MNTTSFEHSTFRLCHNSSWHALQSVKQRSHLVGVSEDISTLAASFGTPIAKICKAMVVDSVPVSVGDFVLLSEEVAVKVEVCGQCDVNVFFVLGMQYTRMNMMSEHSSKWSCTGEQHYYRVSNFKHVHCWSDQGGVTLAVR